MFQKSQNLARLASINLNAGPDFPQAHQSSQHLQALNPILKIMH
jgi:hypothetical protein